MMDGRMQLISQAVIEVAQTLPDNDLSALQAALYSREPWYPHAAALKLLWCGTDGLAVLEAACEADDCVTRAVAGWCRAALAGEE